MTKIKQPSSLSPGIVYGPGVAVLAWVDNFLITDNTEGIKAKISTRFNTQYLSTPMHYIGLQTLRYEDQVTVNLQSYLHRGLEDTGIAEFKTISTPTIVKDRLLLCGPDEEAATGGKTQYQEGVGHYSWAVSITLPDIAWATATLGEFSVNPSAVYEKALKHLNQHIQGTLVYE